MSTQNRHRLITAALPLTLLLAGCSLTDPFGTKKPVVLPPIGVYKSTDRGETWVTKNAILGVGATKQSLDTTSVVSLKFDPTDAETLYLGGAGQGLFVSYGGADSWLQSRGIRSGDIASMAIPNDATERCTIYIATQNKILRSHDCGRSWNQVFIDTRQNVKVVSLAIHPTAFSTIYAAMSTGDMLKSIDGGTSWETIARLGDDVFTIIMHPLNGNIMYVPLRNKGFRKSEDGGATWLDMSEGLKKFSGANSIISLTTDVSRPETIIMATKYGLVRTTDGAKTWEPISLLTPTGAAKLTSVAVNPKDPEQIYYTTDSTLNRSSDAGKTWETKQLPVSGASAYYLLISPDKPNILYLGINRPPKRK